jgi:inorganic pyrophosphatase
VMRELDRFFRDYKVLEGKGDQVDVGSMYHAAHALSVIQKSIDAYKRGER